MVVKYVSDIWWKTNEKIIYWTYRCEDTLELWELSFYYISESLKEIWTYWNLLNSEFNECSLIG